MAMSKDFLPDWLPAVVVRDLRHILRSSLYLLGVLAVVLLGMARLLPTESGLTPLSYHAFVGMCTLLVCCVVPVRMSMLVEAETRNAGTNFLRLTPLSSWQVVWGTWFSGAVQVVLFSLLLVPLVEMRLEMAPPGMEALHLEAHVASMLLMMAQGMMMVALCLIVFTLPLVLRVFAFTVLLLTMGWQNTDIVLGMLQYPDVANWWRLVVVLLAYGIMTVTFLASARRLYAHPAEDCSTPVRRLSLLAFVLYGAVLVFAGESLLVCWQVYAWACAFVVVMTVWDMLQPDSLSLRVLPANDRRDLWIGVGWLCVLVLVCALAVLPLIYRQYEAFHGVWAYWSGLAGVSSGLTQLEVWLLYGYFWVALLVSLLAVLLLCRLFRSCGTLVLAVVLLLEFLVGCVLGLRSLLNGTWMGPADVWSVLPLLPLDAFSMLAEGFKPLDAVDDHMQMLLGLLVVKLLWLVGLLWAFRALSRRK